MKKWLKRHWKAMLIHSVILSSFAVYAFVFAEPLRDWLVAVEDEARPQSIALPAETDDIIYELQGSPKKDSYLLEGYAFISGVDSKGSEIFIVLKSNARTLIFDSHSVEHPDVGSAFVKSDLDLDQSGYYSRIPIRKVRTGKYRIGIYIRKGDRRALQYTDEFLVKSKDYFGMADLAPKPDDSPR